MRLILFLFISMIAVSQAFAGLLLNVPNARPKVSKDWDTALSLTWQGIKARNMQAYGNGLIHRPKSEYPGDAVSEGVGYGMIAALFSGDEAAFDTIWNAGERYLWDGNDGYNWQANSNGSIMSSGIATDADQDITVMLIFADKLVKAGVWKDFTSVKGVDYAQRAQGILNSMWGNGEISQGKYVAPGAGWGGAGFVNPGYFAPAWYRIYKAFDANASSHDWTAVIDQCYTTIAANPGDSIGVGPDWMNPNGSFYNGSLGYNPFDNGHSMYKDGIRILWRIATDALWFGEPRATTFLNKSITFLNRQGGASAANFYSMTGVPSSKDSLFVFDGGALNRPRYEHSHLTIGMWATAAMAVGTSFDQESMSREMAKFYTSGNNFWGRATDSNNEDTLHNEMYFDQFLAWFGVATLNGTFSNIIYDLDNPPPAATRAIEASQQNELQVRSIGRSVQFFMPQGTANSLIIVDTKGRQLTDVPFSNGTATWKGVPGLYVAMARSNTHQWSKAFVVH